MTGVSGSLTPDETTGAKAIRRLVVLALIAAPAAAQDKRPSDSRPTADAPNDKTAMRYSIVYTAEVQANADGGVRRGVRYLDNLDLQLSVDLDRAVGLTGSEVFVYALYNNGVSLSALAGDFQTISNIETGVRAVRLFEAWGQHTVGRASLRAGLYNLNGEFDTTTSSSLFVLSSHGIGADFSQSGQNGPSIFPVTSLAARADYRFGNVVVRAAVLDGVPGDPAHPAAVAAIKLSDRDGALLVAEAAWQRVGTKLAIGTWRYTARFDAYDGSSGYGNAGAYAIAERRFTGSDDRNVAGWLRFGIADTRYNPVASYLGGGIVASGPFAARADDAAGIAVAIASFGSHFRRAAPSPVDCREVIVEATYRGVITPLLTLQPNVQYVINPGGDPARGNASVIGLRVRLGR